MKKIALSLLALFSFGAMAFTPPATVPSKDIALLQQACEIKNSNPTISDIEIKKKLMSLDIGIQEKQVDEVVEMLNLIPEVINPGFNCQEVDIIYNNKHSK